MDNVKNHFEEEAKEFDGIILKLIPYYNQMIEALVSAINSEKKPIKVIDLGCGTGTISLEIKKRFPSAKITCVDIAQNMLLMAENKLREYDDIEYIPGDFNDFKFPEKYDVAVSSLALHHLITNEDKISFYKNIYESLNPGGLFFNADVVLASHKAAQDIYMEKWKQFMSKTVNNEEIHMWMDKYRQEDHPSKLMDQIKGLNEIGFVQCDVIWKYYNFAVYGGYKQDVNGTQKAN